jgi:hypothetical protein
MCANDAGMVPAAVVLFRCVMLQLEIGEYIHTKQRAASATHCVYYAHLWMQQLLLLLLLLLLPFATASTSTPGLELHM